MRALVLPLLAAVLAAGCLAPDVLVPGATPPVLPRFADVVTVGEYGNEPVVRVAPDGTVYVAALQWLYVSRDNGTTFEPVDYRGAIPMYASDPALAMSPEGRVYAAYSWPYAGHTGVCGSSDRGESWECAHLAVPGVTDRFWLLAPTADDVYLITGQALSRPTFAVSHDRGATWEIASVDATSSVQGADLTWDPVEELVLEAAARDDGPGWGVRTFGADGAYHGFTPMDLPSPAGDYVLSVDAAGVWWAPACASADAGCVPAVGSSVDRGASWSVTPVPFEGKTTMMSFVHAGAPGRVALGWYGTNATTSDAADAEWRFYLAQTADGLAWETTTLTPDPVHVGPLCTSVSCLGSNRFAGDFVGVHVAPDGSVHAAWTRQTGEKDLPTTQIQPSGPYTRVEYARTAPAGGA